MSIIMKAILFVVLLAGAFAVTCTGTPLPPDCKDCDSGTTTKCIKCNDKFYLDGDDACQGCHTTCATCKSSADASNCLTCPTTGTLYFKMEDADTKTGTCLTSCASPSYTQEKTCVEKCSDGYTSDTEKLTCTKNFGGYLFSGLAVLVAILTLL